MKMTAQFIKSQRRRAYVLIAVLGLSTIVAALGLSFLELHGTAVPEAINYDRSVRARYVAESGVAIAKHYLMYPPKDVDADDSDAYYTGDSALAVDASADYASVAVQRSDSWSPQGTDLNLYRITAVGVAHDAANEKILAKHTVAAEVVVPPQRKWQIPYALLDRDMLNVISGVCVTGNIHANDAVNLNLGSSYSGNVTSTGTVRSELVLGIFTNACGNSKITCNASAIVCPTGNTTKYENYILNGRHYSAYVYGSSTMNQSNAAALNSIDMSETNPGRIIVYKGGNLRLRANSGSVSLNGTLVITNGNLEFQDAGTYVIHAVENFPALVLPQNLLMTNSDNTNVTINGPVLCVGDIDLGSRRNSKLEINGPLIKTGAFANIRGGGDAGKIDLKQSGTSTFWDFESEPMPITVLSWREQ